MKKILAIFCALCAFSAAAQPQLRSDNVDEVLKAMTLQEKATLLVGSGWGSMVGGLTGSDEVLVSGAAGTTRAIPRLGIPQTVLADGPAGLRINPTRPGTDKTFYCTGFPVGTVLASTWNTALVEEVTTAMGNEVLEYGADVLLAPGMNLHRNPLCGRNFEYFSEDPLLTGKIAAAYVSGIQRNGVGVSIKHYAANSQETNRMNGDSRISPRALRELYLKGFEIAVRETDPWTVMSSYNRLNGPYTQEDRELLYDILREEWGFKGIVMTDWTGRRNSAAQIHAINDLLEPGDDRQIADIVEAVNNGTLAIADVDLCVKNMLEFIVKTPRFKKYKYSNNPDLKAHADVALKAAEEGIVLLENNGVLPLAAGLNVALYGVGSYDFIAGGTGSGNVNKAYVRSVADGLESRGYKLNAAIKTWYQQYIPYIKTTMRNSGNGGGSGVLLGDPVTPEMEVSRAFINRNVASTDLAVLTISRNAGEGGDRKAEDGDWTLTGAEREMLQNLCDAYHVAGKKVVVVLNIGGVIETASWKNLPDAILLAWTPGQEGGYAVADILAGNANPSGKLPMTFPVNYFDIPSSFNFPYAYTGGNSMNPLASIMGGNQRRLTKDVDYTNYEEGIWVGYRYFATAGKEVSYPFGYGLSYTTFAYSKPAVKVAKDGTVTASITVTNTGKVAGKEAVQLYIAAPAGGLEKPACELKAFAKTKLLAPGASETLTMTVDCYALASFNEAASAWQTAAGDYKVFFGASVADIRATGAFKIAKPASWPVAPVCLPAEPINELAVR
ncbi:MAG: glycoside hydrolase family 3 C-terminal domain-containing protein [Bacteroidales bacterium]|nr:glycoside hydrolase family 3 C-terminal domain-containing protein [Bacteroidales bacterium]